MKVTTMEGHERSDVRGDLDHLSLSKAVRFGRVPKREKAKMVEEMQRTSAQSQLDALAVQFENEADAIERIAAAFTLLCST
ncbi:unnamed protein product, partial [Nippostrongylus brasiliensis]|uniref:Uncharacterized protein n=1 Tax=Nippostrongylus brasiliensis TaxID=27835 RepID=A0A0N4XYA1_NIPBR